MRHWCQVLEDTDPCGSRCRDRLDTAHATQELVRIRASQINGSSFCMGIHLEDAARMGEKPLRLNLIAVWREATVFTDAQWAHWS